MRHPYGRGWERLRLTILARDRYVCAYCGDRATSVDHVVPLVDGGPTEPDNLVAACGPCNSRRSLDWIRAHRPRAKFSRRIMLAANDEPIFWSGGRQTRTAVGIGLARGVPGGFRRSRGASGVLGEGGRR